MGSRRCVRHRLHNYGFDGTPAARDSESTTARHNRRNRKLDQILTQRTETQCVQETRCQHNQRRESLPFKGWSCCMNSCLSQTWWNFQKRKWKTEETRKLVVKLRNSTWIVCFLQRNICSERKESTRLQFNTKEQQSLQPKICNCLRISYFLTEKKFFQEHTKDLEMNTCPFLLLVSRVSFK